MQVWDLNGDGVLDVVTTDLLGNTLRVSLGNGDGSLKASVSYQTGAQPKSLLLEDINGDGIKDAIFESIGSPGVVVKLGNADGSFSTAVSFSKAVTSHPSALQVLAVGTFTRGGARAIASSGSSANAIEVHFASTQQLSLLADISLISQSARQEAFVTIESGLQRVRAERGAIGAFQNQGLRLR